MSTAALSGTGKARANPLPRVEAFFEHRTCSVQYVLSDPVTGTCAIIDPVLDYDERSGSVATNSADENGRAYLKLPVGAFPNARWD